jgi:diguanylate cyclase (GGDEF)-like protein/PAS domain S-box-containing protein
MKNVISGDSVEVIESKISSKLNDLGVFSGFLPDGCCVPDSLWEECGYSAEDRKNLNWLDLVISDDRPLVYNSWKDFIDGKVDIFDQTYRFGTKNGKWIWNRSRCTIVSRNMEENTGTFLGINTDITHIKATERELSRAKDHADRKANESETLRNVIGIIAGSLKVSETVEIVFEQAHSLINYSFGTVEIPHEKGIRIIGSFGLDENLSEDLPLFPHPHDKNPVSIILTQKKGLILKNIGKEYPEYPLLKFSSTKIRSWLGIPLQVKNKTIGVLTISHTKENHFKSRDLVLLQALGDHVAIALENAKLHERLYNLAMVDPLMGIGSRHNFNHQGQYIFTQALRYKRELAVLLIDVDFFKKINDTYGHDVGDIVLKEIAKACANVLRESDMIARYGGEEIVAVLPETAVNPALMVAERIRKSVETLTFEEIDRKVSVSIGLYTNIPEKDDSLDHFLHFADEALYQAKESGRNRVVVYESSSK